MAIANSYFNINIKLLQKIQKVKKGKKIYPISIMYYEINEKDLSNYLGFNIIQYYKNKVGVYFYI